MKWILLIASLSMLAPPTYAKDITVSGDSPVTTTTENLLKSADKITIKDEKGRVVAYKLVKVEKNSRLAKLGLKSGDIISMPNTNRMAKAPASVKTIKQ